MTKFNTTDKRAPRTGGPITSNPVPTGTTYNSAPGYARNTKSELFLLAVSNMVGEKTFYEDPKTRDGRFVKLIHQTIAEGDAAWMKRFLPWLRHKANMRTASVVGAAEAARAMATAKVPGGRQLIADVLARADEPGELLAYYMGRYGRNLPKPVARGVGDAAKRLYTEYSSLKYDSPDNAIRFGHVLSLTHPVPGTAQQSAFFWYLIGRGMGLKPMTVPDLDHAYLDIPDDAMMLMANFALRKQAADTPQMLLNTARLRQAGMSWKNVLSMAGSKIPKKDLWEALIPTMGYSALLQNLRNFDEAGVKGDAVEWVKQKLTHPDEVQLSRMLPLQFLSAYRNVPSNRWAQVLETGLELCLNSLPEFAGNTLILIDTSDSMNDKLSKKSELLRWDAAVMFGLALAARCHSATVVSFSSTTMQFPGKKGESLLKGIDRFAADGYMMAHGTDTAGAIRKHAAGHDRIIVLTDEQANVHQGSLVPPNARMITFNLGGYQMGHTPTNRNLVTVGGLSDAAFTLIPALESYGRGEWPF